MRSSIQQEFYKNSMKRIYLMIAKGLLCVFAISLFFACEDEMNTTGSGIVNEVNFETNVASDFSLVSYTKNYPEGVQTNGVPVGVLGIYNDAVYGKTTASFLSQMTLSRFSPEFGDNTVVDSVVLTLPYFSSLVETDTDGNSTYTIDSTFANSGPVKLSVYRSNFFLNDLDPDSGFEDLAVYLSDDITNPSGSINESLVEGEQLQVELDAMGVPNAEELAKLEMFLPDDSEIILTTPETDDDGEPLDDGSVVETARLAPSLRVKLDTQYWQDTIIGQEGNTTLLNPNSFNDYFRGLYFKVESINDEGHLTFFNLENASINIFYSFEGSDDSGDLGGLSSDGEGNIELSMSGISLVNYENDFNATIEDAYQTVDETEGEENLYLKGGDGSIAVVDLFGPRFDLGDGEEFQSELEILRSCGIIVNEANLTFFVDQDEAAAGLGQAEPERIFIYDIDNNRTLLDGAIDSSIGAFGAVDSRTNHLGRLERTDEDNLDSPGVSYRIRLTQHINNIIKNDSTNVRLAIAVSQNVLVDNTSLIAGTGDLETGQRVPVSSVISPEGTILHGNLSTDETKKLRLKIYYTLTEDIDPASPCGQLLGIE